MQNKRDPWPTGLFDCCSGSILFFQCVFVFSLFEERRGCGWGWSKYFTFLFTSKLIPFICFEKRRNKFMFVGISLPHLLIPSRRSLLNWSCQLLSNRITIWTISSLVLSWSFFWINSFVISQLLLLSLWTCCGMRKTCGDIFWTWQFWILLFNSTLLLLSWFLDWGLFDWLFLLLLFCYSSNNGNWWRFSNAIQSWRWCQYQTCSLKR